MAGPTMLFKKVSLARAMFMLLMKLLIIQTIRSMTLTRSARGAEKACAATEATEVASEDAGAAIDSVPWS